MEANLIELAKVCPEAIISVKVGDLIEANEAPGQNKRAAGATDYRQCNRNLSQPSESSGNLGRRSFDPASLGQTWSARAYRNWREAPLPHVGRSPNA